jgi:hypothetical protein
VYNEEVFGNFLIAFMLYNLEKSIVCDRGELGICDDLIGGHNYRVIVPSIYEVGQNDLLIALNSALKLL